MYAIQNRDGLWLNTGGRCGTSDWREKPRYYKSLVGMRSAIGGRVFRNCPNWVALFTPDFIAKFPEPPEGKWDDAFRAVHRAWWRQFYAELKNINTNDYFKALQQDGYKLVRVHPTHVEELLC